MGVGGSSEASGAPGRAVDTRVSEAGADEQPAPKRARVRLRLDAVQVDKDGNELHNVDEQIELVDEAAEGFMECEESEALDNYDDDADASASTEIPSCLVRPDRATLQSGGAGIHRRSRKSLTTLQRCWKTISRARKTWSAMCVMERDIMPAIVGTRMESQPTSRIPQVLKRQPRQKEVPRRKLKKESLKARERARGRQLLKSPKMASLMTIIWLEVNGMSLSQRPEWNLCYDLWRTCQMR